MDRFETNYARNPNQERATSKQHHDVIIKELPHNLDIIKHSDLFSLIELVDRNEDVVYNSRIKKIKPSKAITNYWNEKWTKDEYEMFNQSLTRTRELREKRNYLDNADLK